MDVVGNGYRKVSWIWSKVLLVCVGKIFSWFMVGIRLGVLFLFCCYIVFKFWGFIYYWVEGMLIILVFYLLIWLVVLVIFLVLLLRELGE